MSNCVYAYYVSRASLETLFRRDPRKERFLIYVYLTNNIILQSLGRGKFIYVLYIEVIYRIIIELRTK